jgi:hypothetical protein
MENLIESIEKINRKNFYTIDGEKYETIYFIGLYGSLILTIILSVITSSLTIANKIKTGNKDLNKVTYGFAIAELITTCLLIILILYSIFKK